ncbi:MAG: accessory factor UbiK family protein [Alphaproteobacteria bacterium]|nr:accessory factor UbiK family protein [Alphaproteobacteria bacterium]
MQTRNPILDDLAKVAAGAAGALSGVRDEVEGRIRDQLAKILDGMNLPNREEFDVVRAMAVAAREENEALKARIAELEARLAKSEPPSGA